MKKRCTAIVLAAGRGKRMGTKVQKQFLELQDKPILYYSLNVFEQSEIIDEIILVTSEDMVSYCQQDIVKCYGFEKVTKVIPGGEERYHSVYEGLCQIKEGYVFIHDGARPFLSEKIVERLYREVQIHKACVAGMPVKDTIKVANAQGFAVHTPEREALWQIQTPQVFQVSLIKEAFEKLMDKKEIQVTDDAMVVEQMMNVPVKLVLGSYENIKITTPEDLKVGDAFLR